MASSPSRNNACFPRLLAQCLGMSLDRHAQMAQIKAPEPRKLLVELNQLAQDLERCQQNIAAVMAQLNEVNLKSQGPRATRQDVEYLTVLLDCAKRKLAWEKD